MARSTSRRGGLFSPAAYVRRTSLNKGLLGDDRVWRTIFFVLAGRRVLRKVMGSEPQLVATEKIKPGHALQIASIDPRGTSTKRRKRA